MPFGMDLLLELLCDAWRRGSEVLMAEEASRRVRSWKVGAWIGRGRSSRVSFWARRI